MMRLIQVRTLRHRLRRPLVSAINRIRQVPSWVRQTVMILCAARVVCYTAVLLYWLSPSWCLKKVDPFLCPGYHNPMVAVWYVKYICNDIELLLLSYAFCKVCTRLSDYLFLVSVIFFIYHVIDVVMFVWNFKRYDLLYFDLMWTTLALVWSVFKGYKPETVAKIRSLF